MANDCDFCMHIKGSKSNVEKFYSWLSADYDYTDGKCEVEFQGKPVEHHIGYRVRETGGLDILSEDSDGTVTADTSGYCAWSVYSCMFNGDYTYIDDRKDAPRRKAISIADASAKLDIDIEIFSEEPGLMFSEHFVIRKGSVDVNDCVGLEEHEGDDGEWWYESDNKAEDGDFKWVL